MERATELHERLTRVGEVFTLFDVQHAIDQAVGVKSAKYGVQIDPSLDGIWHNIVEPEALRLLGVDEDVAHPEWVA